MQFCDNDGIDMSPSIFYTTKLVLSWGTQSTCPYPNRVMIHQTRLTEADERYGVAIPITHES